MESFDKNGKRLYCKTKTKLQLNKRYKFDIIVNGSNIMIYCNGKLNTVCKAGGTDTIANAATVFDAYSTDRSNRSLAYMAKGTANIACIDGHVAARTYRYLLTVPNDNGITDNQVSFLYAGYDQKRGTNVTTIASP